jgi:hypothetical protein
MPMLVSQGQEAGKAAEEAKKAEEERKAAEEAARKAAEEAANDDRSWWEKAKDGWTNIAVGAAKVAVGVCAIAAGIGACASGVGVAGGVLAIAGGAAAIWDGVGNISSGLDGNGYEFNAWDLAYAIPLAGPAIRGVGAGAKALRAVSPLIDDAARVAGAGLKVAGGALKALPGASQTMKFMSSSANFLGGKGRALAAKMDAIAAKIFPAGSAMQRAGSAIGKSPLGRLGSLYTGVGKINLNKKPIAASASRGAGNALENANYAQKTYGSKFSAEGQKIYTALAGKPINTVDDLANALKNGTIKPSDVPIDYIIRDGNTLILNTRSSQALTQAGIPRSQWNAINQTGNALFEEMLTNQLSRNGLTSTGTPIVRMSGGGN